ncbi:hypothetical protein L6452_41888 [Arctium lappa]|uniref:Uncharacterized protein n=1 Tax=Arctium lappa TaxID=4217 RepID=A0ACB8XH51_ARCLA|nr:hypothetical protein L6452_41888 [Arctium lappa]
MHIALIRQARPLENATLKKYRLAADKHKKRPLFMSQKKQVDENFGNISECIKSFSSGHNKHIRFISSSSGEDDDEDAIESDDNEDGTCLSSYSKNSSQSMKSSNRFSSCPYPFASEEMTRLGISSGKEESPSLDRFSHEHVADMSLSDGSMMTFITLWKEACKRKNTSEVKSIKHGMWDSMYDNFQTFEPQEEPFTASEGHIDNARIETKQADSRLVSNHVSKQRCEVSLEDILKKVSEFFKDKHDALGDFSSSHLIFLRSVYKCEVWLTEQFVVENLESLGYGEVISEKYILEYGTDCLEMHVGAVEPGERALVVEDLMATDGTRCAAMNLLG